MKKLGIIVLLTALTVGSLTYSQVRTRPKNSRGQGKLPTQPKQEEKQEFKSQGEDTTPAMPNYDKWKLTSEQTKKYFHNGRVVDLYSEHYEYQDPRGLIFQVVIFYYPQAEEPWLAIYMYEYAYKPLSSKSKKMKVGRRAYFFEMDQKEGRWLFIQDVTKNGDYLDVFKFRYGLEYVEEEKDPS